MDLLKAVLDNVAANTQATVETKCFLCGPRPATEELFSVWSVPRTSKRVVFSAWSVVRLYNGSLSVALMNTESRTTETGEEL
jgi:hypothetical protein